MQQLLRDSLQQDAAHIDRLSQSGDWQALREVVHKLHGGTRYCGVPQLENSAGQLEAALRQEAPADRIAPLVQQLLVHIDQVQQAEEITAFMSRTA
jgi:two-component system sensor histidine kinase BarA